MGDLAVTFDEVDRLAPPDRPAVRARADRDAAATVRRWALRLIVAGYLFMLVAWPVALVAHNALADSGTSGFWNQVRSYGLGEVKEILSDKQTRHAVLLTVRIALISVAINTVFGVIVAILIVRYRFPGRRLFNALLDLPLSVSPIVVGLSLLLVYSGRTGWFGPWLEDHGVKVIFSTPGMVLATVFVSLPLVIREVVPVLQEVGIEQELAAHSLGASGWQSFWRITLPGIRWAVVYGVVLTLARSLGEFGAVKVVSGNVLGRTRTTTLVVEEKYLNFNQSAAYAAAFLLAIVSVACIVVVGVIRPKHQDQ